MLIGLIKLFGSQCSIKQSKIFCHSRNYLKKHGQVYEMVTYKIFVTQDSTKTQDSTLLYRGWLKHTMNRDLKRFFNANTWPSFLISLISFLNTWLSFSNSRTNFWFSFKTSKAQWASVSKNRPRVFKYILSQAFCLREFVKVWSL